MTPEKNTKIDEIVAELRRRIDEGVYAPGQRLPSVRELYEELHANAATIRSALMRLQAENLVQVLPRSGTFVRFPSSKVLLGPPRPLPSDEGPIVQGSSGAPQRVWRSGKVFRSRYLALPQIVEIGKETAEKIGIKSGMAMLRHYVVHIIDDVPYRLIDMYKAPVSVEKDPWEGNPEKRLEFRNYELMSCRPPSAEEAALLNISRNQPVIILEIWTWVRDGQFWQYTHVVATGALHEFSYSYDVGTNSTGNSS